MIALFLTLLLFYPAVSVAGDARGVCNSKLAASYANAIANIQYPKSGTSIKGPFEVKSAGEVTENYFKEAGYDAKKIAAIKKYEPVEIYAVSLKSSEQWTCIYYVTLSTQSGRECDFSAVSFHHCSK